jgi:DNA-binding PadR family transcriptional regulator
MHTTPVGVRETLLALLNAEPKYGYQLKAEYDAVASPQKPLNVGQVYTTLDRLVRDGLVEELAVHDADAGDRRRPYRLTPTGRKEVLEWFFEPPSRPRTMSSDVAEKVIIAVATADVDALDVLRAQRARLIDELRPLRRLGHVGTDLAGELATDWKASLIEGELGWLDRAEEKLRRAIGGGDAAKIHRERTGS